MQKVVLLLGILLSLSCNTESKEPICQNGGGFHNNRCHCPPGFFGDKCEKKDSCFDVICGPNKVCKGGMCECMVSFYGLNCDSNIIDKRVFVVRNITISPGREADFHEFANEGDIFKGAVVMDTVNNFLVAINLTHQGNQKELQVGFFPNNIFEIINNNPDKGFMQSAVCSYSLPADSIHGVVKHLKFTDVPFIPTTIGSFDLIKK